MKDTRSEIRGHLNGAFQMVESANEKLCSLEEAGEIRLSLKEIEAMVLVSKETKDRLFSLDAILQKFKEIAKK